MFHASVPLRGNALESLFFHIWIPHTGGGNRHASVKEVSNRPKPNHLTSMVTWECLKYHTLNESWQLGRDRMGLVVTSLKSWPGRGPPQPKDLAVLTPEPTVFQLLPWTRQSQKARLPDFKSHPTSSEAQGWCLMPSHLRQLRPSPQLCTWIFLFRRCAIWLEFYNSPGHKGLRKPNQPFLSSVPIVECLIQKIRDLYNLRAKTNPGPQCRRSS